MSLKAKPMAMELMPRPVIIAPGLKEGTTIVAAVKSPRTQTRIELSRARARTSGGFMWAFVAGRDSVDKTLDCEGEAPDKKQENPAENEVGKKRQQCMNLPFYRFDDDLGANFRGAGHECRDEGTHKAMVLQMKCHCPGIPG